MAPSAAKRCRPAEPFVATLKRQKGLDRKLRHSCSAILESLMNHRHGHFFNHPVDPVALNVPDYFKEIWWPMDLGTVKSKLEKDVYCSADAFAADVRLTFSNALRYYPSGNYIYSVAKHLNGIFETKWTEAMNVVSQRRLPQTVCEGFSNKSKVPDQSEGFRRTTHFDSLSPKSPLCKKALSTSHRNSNTVVCHSKRRQTLDQVLGSPLPLPHSPLSTDLATLVDHAIQHACASVTKSTEATIKLSPAKARRAEMLKCQFKDTILRAKEKLMGLPYDTPSQTQRINQRDKQREIARDRLWKMKKSVEFEDHLQDFKELEILCGSEDSSVKVYLGLPLKNLGLCLKTDELEDEDEETFLNGDWEEGEIRS